MIFNKLTLYILLLMRFTGYKKKQISNNQTLSHRLLSFKQWVTQNRQLQNNLDHIAKLTFFHKTDFISSALSRKSKYVCQGINSSIKSIENRKENRIAVNNRTDFLRRYFVEVRIIFIFWIIAKWFPDLEIRSNARSTWDWACYRNRYDHGSFEKIGWNECQ